MWPFRLFGCIVSRNHLRAAMVASLLAFSQQADAGDTNVAVAANFTAPAKEIAQLFQSSTGHRAILSFGATGQFYTQITEVVPLGGTGWRLG
jgi:molybdate transport system substrate-binding protein